MAVKWIKLRRANRKDMRLQLSIFKNVNSKSAPASMDVESTSSKRILQLIIKYALNFSLSVRIVRAKNIQTKRIRQIAAFRTWENKLNNRLDKKDYFNSKWGSITTGLTSSVRLAKPWRCTQDNTLVSWPAASNSKLRVRTRTRRPSKWSVHRARE